MEEKILKIPLGKVRKHSRHSRANKAVKVAKEELSKHLKLDKDDIYLDQGINEKIWENGIQNPPSKIKVRAMKFEDGVAEVELAEE
ncbi:MAG: Ribosomal protein L31E [Candidatus Methanohalarchaeum thermophilum]|uniref:Large ribosomal subunit protein eL31 n=1 Tax=Methanohalarchaeum thermophilum TaxID=1903181 RepID=A0A1Q6DY11_METT1|nr:MAG: Ribosomal protein L31E [Candidatus Methanohalarchaeum thermophilum]